MRTDKQREASRKNGAKSRGPKTTEGERNSSMNAARRRLLTRTLLIVDESDAHFAALIRQLFDEYQPLPGYETSLVESMAVWRWRQLRLLGMESAAISHEIRNHHEMSQEPLSPITHAVFATRNLTDRSRLLSYIARELNNSEQQYMRAHRALMKAQSNRAKKYHEVEPGVPPPEPSDSLESAENNEPSE